MSSLFIGRFQPPHEGHFTIIQQLLDEGKTVLVGIRVLPVGEDDPLSYPARVNLFRNRFHDEWIAFRLEFVPLIDMDEVVYGREVGYGIREIRLDPEIEAISARNIRRDNMDRGE